MVPVIYSTLPTGIYKIREFSDPKMFTVQSRIAHLLSFDLFPSAFANYEGVSNSKDSLIFSSSN